MPVRRRSAKARRGSAEQLTSSGPANRGDVADEERHTDTVGVVIAEWRREGQLAFRISPRESEAHPTGARKVLGNRERLVGNTREV